MIVRCDAPEVDCSPFLEGREGAHEDFARDEETDCVSGAQEGEDSRVPVDLGAIDEGVALDVVVPIVILPRDVRAGG